MKRIALCIGVALLVSACGPSYNFLSITDHPEKQLTVIEVQATRPVIPGLYSQQSQEFWLCRDNGNELDCDRVCTPSQEYFTSSQRDPEAILCPEVGGTIGIKRTYRPGIQVSTRKSESTTPSAPVESISTDGEAAEADTADDTPESE